MLVCNIYKLLSSKYSFSIFINNFYKYSVFLLLVNLLLRRRSNFLHRFESLTSDSLTEKKYLIILTLYVEIC